MESDEIIYLNVGGTYFTTCKQTLTKFPGSMLAVMFNGNIPVKQDREGRYFIDRSGKMFDYVLQFLRSNQLVLPEGFSEINLLECEADFYQIEALIDAIEDYKEIKSKQNEDNRTILFCSFRGHHLDGRSINHYKVFTKSKYTDFKEIRDLTYDNNLDISTWKNILRSDWDVDKKSYLDVQSAMAFFLIQGIDTNVFQKYVTYSVVDVETWTKKFV